MKRSVAAAAIAVLLVACTGDRSPTLRLPDVRLPTLGGPAGPSLASCPTAKCLTVVVAPWCGVCHATAPAIIQLRRFLDSQGVPSRVVVGLAEIGPIREFAAEFGSDALLDESGALRPQGVPLFLVSGRDGLILNRINGFPSAARDARGLAEALGLP